MICELGFSLKLEEFKSKYLRVLEGVKSELLSSYPEKRDEIVSVIELIERELRSLSLLTLRRYLDLVYQFAGKYIELNDIVPKPSEVEDLIRERDCS